MDGGIWGGGVLVFKGWGIYVIEGVRKVVGWIGLQVLAHMRDGCLRPFCGDGLDERGVVMSYSF